MATLFIRAEGRAEMGLGHLIRSFALAKMLPPLFPVHFVINPDAPESIRTELQKNVALSLIKDDEGFLALLQKGDGVVLDGYHFPTSLQKQIKDRQVKLVSIDDMHDKHFYADLIINQALDITEEEYSAEPFTKFLFGPHYALLRDAFLKKKTVTHQTINSIFICFGGSDYHNITQSILTLLEEAPLAYTINVVLGAAYQHQGSIVRLKAASKHTVNLFHDIGPAEMAAVMSASDIAFVPCSSILMEVLSVGVVAIAGYYTENQLDIYNSYTKNNLVIGVGDYNQISKKKDTIFSVLEQEYFPQVAASATYFDCQSPKRIAKAFIKLFFPDWGVTRPATENDSELLFHWVNDPETRSNAIHQDVILWEHHTGWFDRQLADPASYLFIAEFCGVPVGQIRFDVKDKYWDITYAVAPGYRGVGLGGLIVSAGIRNVSAADASGRIFRAFVREANTASCKVFEKLKFRKAETATFNDSPFLQYQLSQA